MRIALAGATIYTSPFDPPIRDGAIVIDGSAIADVGSRDVLPRDVDAIDCSGLTITAGFWNSHVHFFERKWANVTAISAHEATRQLEAMLTRYGFTTVFDLSSMWENTRALRDRIESGEVKGPRILTTGPGLAPPNSMPPDAVWATMGVTRVSLPEVADAAQSRDAARKLLDDGVDGIKLFASSPRSEPLAQATIEAAVREAHDARKPVFLHPNGSADVLNAVRGGVDVIAHTSPHGGPWDDALLSAMLDARVALTPTLWIWKWAARHDRLSMQEQIANTAIEQLRAFSSAGGTILFGTDLGAVDPDPTDEFLMMREAGMTFQQILASLTTAPAERFGSSARIERNAPADVVVLARDPSIDVRAFADVAMTIRGGAIVFSRSASR